VLWINFIFSLILGVQFHFEHEYSSAQLIPEDDRMDQMNVHRVNFVSKENGKVSMTTAVVVGADGVHSDVARYVTPDQKVVNYNKDISVNMLLDKYRDTSILENCQFGYRELTIPYKVSQEQGLEWDTFHIWSGGNMIVLGLPSPDGSMTIGIYGPTEKMKSSSCEELITEVAREFPELKTCLGAVSAAELDKVGLP
jgi:2-polyprenyl-6-methoxyphenol hydroxylase-like FAD-dependent oxidoreductase